MQKIKKVLSLMLAGAMAVMTMTACDDKDDDKNSAENLSAKERLEKVFDDIDTSLSKFGTLSTGKADSASNATYEVVFSDGFNSMTGLSEQNIELKPVTVTMDTKLKGKNVSADYGIKYDGKDIASVNLIGNTESDECYLSIPELSDAYLSFSDSDLVSLITSNSSTAMSALDSGVNADFAGLLSNSQNFRSDEVEDFAEKVIDIVKANLPQAVEDSDYEGDIDGVKYSYKSKKYTITYSDVKKITDAVLENLKTDQEQKAFAMKVLNSLSSGEEITDENYQQMIDSFMASYDIDMGEEASDASVDVTLLYDGDDIAGVISDAISYISVDEKNDYIISAKVNGLEFKSAAKNNGNKVDLTVSVNYSDSESSDMSPFDAEMKIAGLYSEVKNDTAFIFGDVTASFSDGENVVEISDTGANTDANEGTTSGSLKVKYNSEDIVSVNYSQKLSSASDITMPSGTVYSYDQLDEYSASLDVQKLMDNIKNALGEDDYNSLMNAISASGGDEIVDGEIDLAPYYNDDGTFNDQKFIDDYGQEEYDAFISQIDPEEDFDIDVDDIDIA